MSKYNYMNMSKDSQIFDRICEHCDREIVEENLSINGRTKRSSIRIRY